MNGRRILWGVVAVLGAVLAGVALWTARLSYRLAEADKAVVSAGAENRELKTRLEAMRSQLEAERLAAEAPELVATGATPAPAHSETKYLEDTQTLRTLREGLAKAREAASQLEARAAQLEGQLEKAREDQKRSAAFEADVTEQLASSKRLVDAIQAELKSKSDRVVQLELRDQRLREEIAAASAKAGQSTQVMNDLQEIYRRREVYLNSIISRYRDITDQYRALSGVIENRRGPNESSPSGVPGTSAELARIQTGISMAEDDLRQLSSLNAQALRLQRKLSGK